MQGQEMSGRAKAPRWVPLAVVVPLTAMLASCGSSGSSTGASSSAGAKSKSPLVFANLEGAVAEGGPDFTRGINIAVRQINAAGGVDGRKIVVKTFPKGLKPNEATSAYRSAASDASVLTAYVGGTGGVVAIAGQAPREKLPILEQAGRTDLVEPAHPYVYAMSWDKEYPSSSVRWAVENKGAKKIAILHYEDDYSSGITDAITERCKELGCSVTTSQSGAADASVDQLVPLLTKMKNSGADTYYVETLNPNAAKAARQLGMFDKTVISEQWLSVPAVATATGAAGEDVVFAAQKCLAPSLAAPGDPGAAFCKAYKAAFSKAYPGQPYALFSVYGHDAVNVFAKAAGELMKQGKEVTRESINDQYEKFDGSLQTSHGKVQSSATQHHLTGPFEQGYLLYELKANGKGISYVLAPNADPHGAKP